MNVAYNPSFITETHQSPKPSPSKRVQLLLSSKNIIEYNAVQLLARDKNGSKEFCNLSLQIGKEYIAVHKCLIGCSSLYFANKILNLENPICISNDLKTAVTKFLKQVYCDTSPETNNNVNLENLSIINSDFLQLQIDFEDSIEKNEEKLLEALNGDRFYGQKFCDATIKVENKHFFVHKCLLSVYSSFFAKLFSTEMKEKYESVNEVKGINPKMMEEILNFIYTKETWVVENDVIELMMVADYFGMTYLEKICMELLPDVELNNCIPIWRIATKFHNFDLQTKAVTFISNNSSKILSLQSLLDVEDNLICDFLCLLEEKRLEPFGLPGQSADKILHAAIRWTKYDLENRGKVFSRIYSRFRSANLKPDTLKVLSENYPLIQNSEILWADLLLYLKFSQYKKEEVNLGKIYIIIDDCETLLSCDLSNVALPGPPNYIFDIKWDVKEYEATLPESSTCRYNTQLVVCHEDVYIFGGYSDRDIDTLSDVIHVNMLENLALKHEMFEKRQQAATAVLNDTIYIAGGIGFNNKRLACMESFDIFGMKSDCVLPSMNGVRCNFALIAYDEHLYAFGGRGRSENVVRSIERFSFVFQMWEIISVGSPPLGNLRLFKRIEDKVYFVNQSASWDVHVYDLINSEWIEENSSTTIAMCQLAKLATSLPDYQAFCWQ